MMTMTCWLFCDASDPCDASDTEASGVGVPPAPEAEPPVPVAAPSGAGEPPMPPDVTVPDAGEAPWPELEPHRASRSSVTAEPKARETNVHFMARPFEFRRPWP